jgi:hypothetical protein
VGSGAGFGGAIFEYAGTLTLNNDTFNGNSAVGGSGGHQNGQGKGGALFVYSGATATSSGLTFSGSVAADAGAGGIGNSATPYTAGATCPGQDTVDICGQITDADAPLTVYSGDNQSGAGTRTLPQPFILQTQAAGSNITFTVVKTGDATGAFVGGGTSAVVATDSQGFATSPQLTLSGDNGSFTVTASDGINTSTFHLTANLCVTNPAVTLLTDSGVTGELRYAVNNACAGSTIDLSALTGKITLSSRLRLDDSLTIKGPGANSLAIDGGGSTRLFFIGGGTVSISGLTLQNGLGKGGDSSGGGGGAGMGGAIYQNGGSLTISGVAFSGNKAQGGTLNNAPGSGGGGFGGGGAYLGSEGGSGGFGGGSAGFPGLTGSGAGFGGAIFEYAGTLTLTNDTFNGNSAVGGSGGHQNGQGKGGALFIYSGATATAAGVTFGTGNAANVAAAAGVSGIGNSAAPYTNGATCPGEDDVNVCGTVIGPVLLIGKSHTGSFTQGDTGDIYTITVANNGPGGTLGTLSLVDTLPTGMTATAMSETAHSGGGTGSDWSCGVSTATCTRTTPMPVGESDTITLTVSVGYSTATGTNAVTNSVSVSGANISATQTANNPTTIVVANTATFLPLDAGTQGNWVGAYGADGYIIANDANSPPLYATVNFTGSGTWTWIPANPSSDQRLLQAAPTGSNRIGSTYYSGTNFSIDVNLTDGQLHQVALYLLDLDTTTRNDTITIRNAANQSVLDTRTISNFHNGVWAVWKLSGHVTIQVANNGGLNAVVSGLFFSTLSPPPAGPVVTIYSPTASQNVTGAITLSANVTAAAGVQNVQFVLDNTTNLSPLIPGNGATYTYQWNSATVTNAQHTLKVIGTDNLAQSNSSSVTFTVSNSGAPSASAAFQSADTGTHGNWVGKYGTDGFLIANDPSSVPAVYATTSFPGAATWTWNGSTNDARALLASPTGSPNARIASTYYSNTSFTIDLNLTDNQAHQVALYLLDFDDGRSETIKIVDANSPSTVLDTRSVSGFQSGEYLVWTVQGHVQIQVTGTVGLNGVVSGLFFATAAGGGPQAPPSVTVTAPTANQQVSGTFKLQATATSKGSITSVQFMLDGTTAIGPPIAQGTNSTYSYNWDTTTVGNSTHVISAVATDNLNQQNTASAVSFSVSNAAAGGPNSATFVKVDTATEGNWKGVYGGLGESIANDSSNLPSSIVVSFSGANLYTWAFTSDPRAPLTASSTNNRIASAFYSSPGFSIDVNFTDGNTHQIALYLLDWDHGARVETINILDAGNSNVLSSRAASNFANGAYLIWNVQGHVVVQVNDTAGANAVVSGLFFQ